MKTEAVTAEKELKKNSPCKDRILLAEDHPGLQRMISGFLRDKGYLVTAADNGSQAYESLLVSNYDIIILDINMPKMGGIEAVKAIRQQKPNAYILLISGEADSFEISEGIRLGANAFLPKPFSLEKLLEMIIEIDFDLLKRNKNRGNRKDQNKGCPAPSWFERVTGFITA